MDCPNPPKMWDRSEDELFRRACEHVTWTGRCSVIDLQRTFRIGVMKAFRLIEKMEQNGVISPPRDQLN